MSRYARELDLRELNAHTQGILLTPPGSDVLDVGTADGHPVVEGLKARGCRVWGVEIDPEAAEAAAPMCEQMVVGNVEQLDLAAELGDQRFDVVLCLDVLEHLVEPLDTLRRLKDLLRPGGIVVASIPNVTHAAVRLQLLDGSFTYTDTGLLDRTHVRFFDRAEVTALFEQAELTVLERLEVRREPHETEIPLDLSTVPPETLEAVKKDPDSRVFQWMLVARPAVATEVETTGLATALLDEVTRKEQAVRESAEHVAWLEERLHEQDRLHRLTITQNERLAELDRAQRRERLVRLDQLGHPLAQRADAGVKDAYVSYLQSALGLPHDSVTTYVDARAAHVAVDRAIVHLQRHPKALTAVQQAARVGRKLKRMAPGR
jgi:2-polyprenyl-3-methyl-5-hydroxy-6-metoxy-1,4-benzoquinol methylase